jgi:hypothetical protein
VYITNIAGESWSCNAQVDFEERFEGRAMCYGRLVLGYASLIATLHVSVPNHGKLWKSLMRAHLGEYEALEAKLRRPASRLSLHRP